jgi:molecular chaperone Hsp33
MASLLHRLFHEEVLEIFTSKSIYYECQQERERFENIVLNLGEEFFESALLTMYLYLS